MGWNVIIQYLILTIFFCIVIILVLCLVLVKTLEKKTHQRIAKQTHKQKEELLEKARLDAEEIINKANHAKATIEHEIERMKGDKE